jgi:hypothetical protein
VLNGTLNPQSLQVYDNVKRIWSPESLSTRPIFSDMKLEKCFRSRHVSQKVMASKLPA